MVTGIKDDGRLVCSSIPNQHFETKEVTITGPRGAIVYCPTGWHRSGCSSLCFNAKPGGSTPYGPSGCQGSCDFPDSYTYVTAYCIRGL